MTTGPCWIAVQDDRQLLQVISGKMGTTGPPMAGQGRGTVCEEAGVTPPGKPRERKMAVEIDDKNEMDDNKSNDGGWRETLKIFVHALILAVFVRIFFYQPFNIPSGSMKKTLLIGDYLFVSKLSYGYSRYSFPFSLDLFNGRIFSSQPKRGDVIVFKLPRDNKTDYIKRLIGMPGDTVQMRGGVLYINDKAVPKRLTGEFIDTRCYGGYRACAKVRLKTYEETLPNGVKYTVLDEKEGDRFDDTKPYTVPKGHYFMMGDNRDNSADSRVDVGFVPFENLVGRADIIFFSAETDVPGNFGLLKPWTWPTGIRWNRFFKIIR